MQWLAANWEHIVAVINMIGLLIVGTYKGKK